LFSFGTGEKFIQRNIQTRIQSQTKLNKPLCHLNIRPINDVRVGGWEEINKYFNFRVTQSTTETKLNLASMCY